MGSHLEHANCMLNEVGGEVRDRGIFPCMLFVSPIEPHTQFYWQGKHVTCLVYVAYQFATYVLAFCGKTALFSHW